MESAGVSCIKHVSVPVLNAVCAVATLCCKNAGVAESLKCVQVYSTVLNYKRAAVGFM